jgi:hypothetical protein
MSFDLEFRHDSVNRERHLSKIKHAQLRNVHGSVESSHLEELERVGIKVSEGMSTFLLDDVLEMADGFCFLNLDMESVVRIIFENIAIE